MPAEPQEIKIVQIIGDPPKYEGKWSLFKKQLEVFFRMNSIEDDKKTYILLNSINSQMFQLITTLVSPKEPIDEKYKDIVDLVDKHLDPTPNPIVERHNFNIAKQETNESVPDFIARLRKLATTCDYGTTLDNQLRDAIVRGIRNSDTKKKLFEKGKDLTLSQALEIVKSSETAEQNTKQVNGETPSTSSTVYFQSSSGSNSRQNKCNNCGRNNHSTANCRVPKTKCDYCGKNNHQSNRCYFKKDCSVCGRSNHTRDKCRYRDLSCNFCKRKGHLANVCRDKAKNKSSERNSDREVATRSAKTKSSNLNFQEDDDDIDTEPWSLYSINDGKKNPEVLDVVLDGISLTMQIDSGSTISAMSLADKTKYFRSNKVHKTSRCFKDYIGNKIEPVGYIIAQLRLNSREKCPAKLYIFQSGGPPLLGRDLMELLGIRCHLVTQGGKINHIEESDIVKMIREKYPNVIATSDNIGRYNKELLHIPLKVDAKPIYIGPRPLPFGLKKLVEEEIDRLLKLKIIEPTVYSEWGTPIVPLLKDKNSVKISGAYNLTVNKNILTEHFPIPRKDDILAEIRPGCKFSKFDLKFAYQQMGLDLQSQDLTTITTHIGNFKYRSLPHGISIGPARFQNTMEKLLAGIKGLFKFFDDWLIAAENEEEHLKIIHEVLRRLSNAGLRINLDKCRFFVSEVTYLGHRVSQEGIKPLEKRVQAIIDQPKPQTVRQVKAFLGMVNHYSKFIEARANMLKPLYELSNSEKFYWDKDCDAAFAKIKKEIASDKLLVHFDENRKLILNCDSSEYGIGAVLSHEMDDGSIRPIAYASRTLSQHEKNYSQLMKEALAIIFGVKYFHQFVYLKKFVIVTDHKPLTAIFDKSKNSELSMMAANRVLRWSMFLSNYNYEIQFTNSENNSVADALSRLPSNAKNTDNPDDNINSPFINFFESVFNVEEFIEESKNDSILRQVYNFVKKGKWPKFKVNKIEGDLRNYYLCRDEIYIENGLLYKNNKLIVPKKLQLKVLNELHSTHFGIGKLKSTARYYYYWPNMTSDIVNLIKNCSNCLENGTNVPKNKMESWPYPSKPGVRLHADFCFYKGKNFLIVIDEYSKHPEIYYISNITTDITIQCFRDYFARWGIPKLLVTDNGTQFTANEFIEFCTKNNVKKLFSPPYHPQSNGAAENFVRTFKDKFVKILHPKSDANDSEINRIVNSFLFDYRNMVHETTGKTPNDLQLNRKIRCKNEVLSNVIRQQAKQKKNFKGKSSSIFKINDVVYFRNYSGQRNWVKGVIISQISRFIFAIRDKNGINVTRHVNQIKKCTQELDKNEAESNVNVNVKSPSIEDKPSQARCKRKTIVIKPIVSNPVTSPSTSNVPNNSSAKVLPNRTRQKPAKYNDYV
ncbi:uncharacterized protein K02A2.6-like [Planococcus citri]|uniref:uncharacterized protein K02A2.6-like n=1 Tax=Planococcus citri TaxID=170843 RepID=UPI0031F73B5C